MPRPRHNPFRISEADSSVNFIEEQHHRRQRKKWAVSRAKKADGPPSDGKFFVNLDHLTSTFLHKYSKAMELDYGSALNYLLGTLAVAYDEGAKDKVFIVATTWDYEREEPL